MFIVHNKNFRGTSLRAFWCQCCLLWTDFTHSPGVPIIDFEQVNAGSVKTAT